MCVLPPYTKDATAVDEEYEQSAGNMEHRLEPLKVLAEEFGEKTAEDILLCLLRNGMTVVSNN